MKLFDWLNSEENKFFTAHVAGIVALSLLFEVYFPIYTTLSLPAVLLLAVSSFMWNYPAASIKEHGLFSEWMIDLRILWLVVIGLIVEYSVVGLIGNFLNLALMIIAGVVGLVLAALSRNRLQENLVKARGYK